ncbi:MAG: hypothetical protein ACI4V5_05800 [Prevotella sp.]
MEKKQQYITPATEIYNVQSLSLLAGSMNGGTESGEDIEGGGETGYNGVIDVD